jgi:hypothetical protein
MALFFASPLEKKLNGYLKKSPTLEIKYRSGNKPILSRLLKIYPNGILIDGAKGMLVERELDARFIESQEWFETTVLKKGTDPEGYPVFLCSFPEKIYPPREADSPRFYLFPEAEATLLFSNRGEARQAQLKVLWLSKNRLALRNTSPFTFKIGQILPEVLIKIGKDTGMLLRYQVTSVAPVTNTNEPYELLELYLKTSANMTALLQKAEALGIILEEGKDLPESQE